MTQELREAMFGDSDATHEIDTLVDEATTTNDPFVYATAVQACHAWDMTHKLSGRCQLITLERWTQLDGGNLVPWLFRAAAAQTQGDAAARSEALYRASIASASRSAGQELMGRALPSMPKDVSELERWRLSIEAAGVAAAWVFPPLNMIARYCTTDALRDANLHQICDGLASVLVDKSDTLMERAIGIRMAERLGWPTERVEALKKERDASYQVAFVNPPDSMDCASLKNQNAIFFRRARMGELAFTRELMVESKQTVDALAKRYGERRRAASERGAMLIRDFAASAASASAVSAADVRPR